VGFEGLRDNVEKHATAIEYTDDNTIRCTEDVICTPATEARIQKCCPGI